MFASHYCLNCPDEATRAALKKMIAKALDMEMTMIDANGGVSLEGSTRTPLEKGRSGKPKTMDYKVLMMGYGSASNLRARRNTVRRRSGLRGITNEGELTCQKPINLAFCRS